MDYHNDVGFVSGNNKKLGTIAIIGLGLIGGSLARALKRNNAVDEIIALDTNHEALQQALSLQIIDCIARWGTLSEADIIVLATPVNAFYVLCEKLARLSLKEKVIITDVGSTKSSVVEAVQRAFGYCIPNFVAAHPIAGLEKSGLLFTRDDLFTHHQVILIPLPETEKRAIETIYKMWCSVGAVITQMTLSEHDEIFGATSHLPHVLAYLLVDMLGQDLRHNEIFNYAAGGFRDFTRIASSNPIMWRDICLHNSDVLQMLLAQFRKRLVAFETLLASNDGSKMEMIFTRAKLARDAHYDKEKKNGDGLA